MTDEQIMIRPEVLRQQYADDARLNARQSVWRGRPGPTLYQTVVDLAALDGTEAVVDVGCGNGAYLAELRLRGHRGPVLGLDLSAALARQAGQFAATAVADAQALPLSDGCADVGLSLHMLYHVPDIDQAIAELRRVLRPGGRLLVSTNGPGHTAEIKAVLTQAAAQVAGIEVDRQWDARRFAPHQAREDLAGAFDAVLEHTLGDSFPVPEAAAVSGYVASWPPEAVGLPAGATWDAILVRAAEIIGAHVARHGGFTVTSELAVFICR